jgi:predicted alpha/beta hydrolase family esterase
MPAASSLDAGSVRCPGGAHPKIIVPCYEMSPRHVRRRRLLTDDSLVSVSDAEGNAQIRLADNSAGEPDPAPGPYACAARFDRERPLDELFPTRYLTIGLVVAASLMLVGLLEMLHVWSRSLSGALGAEDVAALSLDGTRNVSHWFASTSLTLTSLVAMFIYSLRRHRVDDYHGRYRVWIWTAIGCLSVSLAESSDVALLAHNICRRAAGLFSLSDQVVWPAIAGSVLTAIGIRLLVEVRRCGVAIFALSLSAASLVVTASLEHGWPIKVSEASTPLAERGFWLVGYVFLLATLLLYARHVLLEIEGLVVVAPTKPKRPKTKPVAPRPSETLANNPPPKPALHLRSDLEPVEKPTSANPLARPVPAWTAHQPAAVPANSGASRGEQGNRGLSRAERRRLRREAKMAS